MEVRGVVVLLLTPSEMGVMETLSLVLRMSVNGVASLVTQTTK